MGKNADFMCLTIIYPATGWFGMDELPVIVKNVTERDKTTEEVVINKSPAEVARLFNRQWLSRYSRVKYITYDNGVNSNFTSNHYVICSISSVSQPPSKIHKQILSLNVFMAS